MATSGMASYGTKRISYGPKDWLDWRLGSGNTVEIFDINVDSESRRSGRGRRMVDKLIDSEMPKETAMVWAITRSDNLIAQQFYEKMRFRVVAVLRNFYQDSHVKRAGQNLHYADAIMYGRDIGSQA